MAVINRGGLDVPVVRGQGISTISKIENPESSEFGSPSVFKQTLLH